MGKHLAFLEREKILKLWLFGRIFHGKKSLDVSTCSLEIFLHDTFLKLWLFGRIFHGKKSLDVSTCSLEIFLHDTAFLLILLAWPTFVKRFLDRDTYSSEVSFHSMNDAHYLLYFNKIRFPEAYLADLTE